MTTTYDGFTLEEATVYSATATGVHTEIGSVVLRHHLLIDGQVREVSVDVGPYALELVRVMIDGILDLQVEEE